MAKKFTLLFSFALALLLAGCYKDFPFDFEPKAPKPPVQINFTQTNLFPEGIAYHDQHNWFYVSSTSRGDIGIVTYAGTYTPFITDETLISTTGLNIDKARQRLWVCNAPNGIGVYDLKNGSRLFYTNLAALLPAAPVFINDVALDPEGNAYVTNSFSPVIYKVTREGKASIFFQNTAFATAPGSFGFNGIAYDERGFLLVAFSTRNQLVKIPVKHPTEYALVQLNATLNGPDGLLLSKDGKQLVIVNNAGGSADGKVLSFISQDQWKSGSLSTTFPTGAVLPTTATSDGKRVFVLYSYLHKQATGQNEFTIKEVPLQKANPF